MRYAIAIVALVAGFSATLHAAQPIDAAVELLGATELAPIVAVEKKPNYVAPYAEAFVVKGRDIIYIPKDTQLWQLATAGDKEGLIRLAAVIAHEQFHLEHGLDEAPAGEVELTVLRRLGASQKLIEAKWRAHMVVNMNVKR